MTNNREIITQLNKVGVNVLEIFSPLNRSETLVYYATDAFVPAQLNIYEHSVEGMDITRIIQEDSLQIHINKGNVEHRILTKMQELESSKVKFSKDYTYVWYLSK